MPNIQTAERTQTAANAATLDQHYRAIGISAVAAAARYPNEKRRPEYAPVYTREQD
jgi:hypothetical protein